MMPARNHESMPSDAAARGLGLLARALDAETRQIIDLRNNLAAQRDAVSREDGERLTGTVHQIQRILLGLDESRRARGDLMETLTGGRDIALDELETRTGLPLSAELITARARLGREAREAALEAAINREVLERVMQTSEAFLQRLFTTVAGETPVYHATADESPAAAGSGLLLNRTV